MDERRRAVLRVLGGARIEDVARELEISPIELRAWHDAFLAGGRAGLHQRGERLRASAPDSEDATFREAFYQGPEAMITSMPNVEALAVQVKLQPLAANDAACRLFGGNELEVLRAAPSGMAAPEDPRLAHAIAERRRTGRYRGDLLLVRLDGTRFEGEISTAMYRAGDGELRTIAVFRDATRRAELDRIQDEFVSTVSHELRTPLASVRGALGLLEAGVAGALPDTAMKLVKIGRSSADRLIRLVNDMLDLERIQSGGLALYPARVELEFLVRSAIATLDGMARLHDVKVVAKVRDRPVLQADRDRLTQVLTNLVGNAIKFSPAGGEVLIEAWREGARVVVTVADSGPGIPEGRRDALFRRFQQLESGDTRPKGGTGLGLVISRSIVEQHGGSIHLDTSYGRGARFRIELPIEAPPTAGERRVGSMALLVAADTGTLALMRAALEPDGYRVEHATTIAQVSALLEVRPPQVVVLAPRASTAEMAEMTQALRAQRWARTVPFVLLEPGPGVDAGVGLPGVERVEVTRDPERLRSAVRRAVRALGTRILIVDADAGRRALVVAALRQLEADCVETDEGVQALRLAATLVPDVIVIDLALARPLDFEVLARLRAAGGNAPGLVTFGEGEPGERERERLVEIGAQHQLWSNLALGELVSRVYTALAEAKAR